MAYEDYWKEDPMPNFSDDVSFYDEDAGYYDEFGEKIDDPGLTPEAAEDEQATDEATPTPTTPSIDRDFRETLDDPATSDQLEDEHLHDEAEREYDDTP